MGSRDFRHHETKKPKKNAKKLAPVDILTTAITPVEVEVIKKGKKPRSPESEA